MDITNPRENISAGVKRKHLTREERVTIEQLLNEGKSIRAIAAVIGKCHTTISREIRVHRLESTVGAVGRIPNRCIYRRTCTKQSLCEDLPNCTRKCSLCRRCNSVCTSFVEEVCPKLSLSPYVCNGCKERPQCTLRKYFYRSKQAHTEYRKDLSGQRKGANITLSELTSLDEFVLPLIKQGQSIHHIIVNNPCRFNMNEKTVYNYVAQGLLTVRRRDLPRAIFIRPRTRKSVEHKVDKKCTEGRHYFEYLEYRRDMPDIPVVYMDTVIGRIGGKVLLTLMFERSGFLYARLCPRKDAQSMIDAFTQIKQTLVDTGGSFAQLFPLILTDNGTEFSDPSAIESMGTPYTRVFYCEPNSPYQKGALERNHENLRKILPKGSSFDSLTQQDIDLVLSHVNSYSRPVLNDVAPITLFETCVGADLLSALNIRRISPNDIRLKPDLLIK